VKKLLVAGIAGLMLMAAAGTQTAMAAPWRGAYHGHFAGRPAYRTAYARPHYFGGFRGPILRDRCF
jgi:hypothetical protein